MSFVSVSIVRAEGHRPFSSPQLAYPGSVGSQMLMGIAWLERVRINRFRRVNRHLAIRNRYR